MTYDLKIINGTLVDGTGAPPVRGDLGIKDGVIVAVGHAPEDANEVIDATGRFVTPGFIDIHTHLDAQIIWDRTLTYSPWHGITSVVMGNCGFGIAPTRPSDRDAVMGTLEKAEGMALATLEEGLGDDWGFETFPEYMKLLEDRGCLINVGVFLGHTPLRYYVMGVDDAVEREATPEEVAKMVAIVQEAMEVGAMGFSTSKTLAHAGFKGLPVASRASSFDELKALAAAMKPYERGLFQASFGPGLGPERLGELADASGRPVTFAALMTDMGGPGFHRETLARIEAVQAKGQRVIPQVSCRPMLQAFTMNRPYPVAVAAPSTLKLPLLDGFFQVVMDTESPEGKLEFYRDPAFRQAFVDATENDEWYTRLWSKMFVLEAPDKSLEQRSMADIARDSGEPAALCLLDLAIETNLDARFVLGHINGDEQELQRLLAHPGTQLGLSDAGAHVSEIYDQTFPTYMLGHWVRDTGAFTVEEAVHMMTGSAADLLGLDDRGVLAVGKAADVVVFDPESVATDKPQLSTDLPAQGVRLVADAIGITNVIVNGVEIRRDNRDVIDPSADLPGRVLKPAPVG